MVLSRGRKMTQLKKWLALIRRLYRPKTLPLPLCNFADLTLFGGSVYDSHMWAFKAALYRWGWSPIGVTIPTFIFRHLCSLSEGPEGRLKSRKILTTYWSQRLDFIRGLTPPNFFGWPLLSWMGRKPGETEPITALPPGLSPGGFSFLDRWPDSSYRKPVKISA